MALSYYYVDPVGGDDVGGTGAIGDPWQTTQHALDNAVVGADGCQINLRDTGADTLAASLNYTAYKATNGTSQHEPIIIRGYTAAANDGGIGELDGNGGNFVIIDSLSDTMNGVALYDLDVHNSGTADGINVYRNTNISGCSIYNIGGRGIYGTFYNCNVVNNYIACADYGIYIQQYSLSAYNIVDVSAGSSWGIYLPINTTKGSHFDCVLTGPSSNGIYLGAGVYVLNASVYGASGGGTYGIFNSGDNAVIANCIVANLTGVGAYGISGNGNNDNTVLAANAFWNCTNDSDYGPNELQIAADIALGANPFVDAPNLDFSLTATSTARNAGWPSASPNGTTAQFLDIGAAQHVDPSGGGRRPRIRWHGV